jgi:hypothetical protein
VHSEGEILTAVPRQLYLLQVDDKSSDYAQKLLPDAPRGFYHKLFNGLASNYILWVYSLIEGKA